MGYPDEEKPLREGVLVAANVIGAIPGSFIAGLTLKRGRKFTLILADIIGILGCILMGVADYWSILAGRIVCGVAVGINLSAIAIYCTEMMPK